MEKMVDWRKWLDWDGYRRLVGGVWCKVCGVLGEFIGVRWFRC